MRDQRIAGALAAIQRGIELAKNGGDTPREEIRHLRLAIEEIRNGLAVIENHLAELEREVWDDEQLSLFKTGE